MDTIVSVQDIRTSLGSISKRVQAGETFTVIRNSKPAFRIVPVEREREVRETGPAYQAGRNGDHPAAPSLEEVRHSLDESGADKLITPKELDRLIHEVHEERNERLRQTPGRKE